MTKIQRIDYENCVFYSRLYFYSGGVALICIFLFSNGIPAMMEIGIPEFLLGSKWKPTNDISRYIPYDPGKC